MVLSHRVSTVHTHKPGSSRPLLLVATVVLLIAVASGCTPRSTGADRDVTPSALVGSDVIRPENITELQQVGRWGLGRRTDISAAEHAGLLAIASPLGVFLYDAVDLSETNRVETNSRIDQITLSPSGALLASTQLPVNGVTVQRVEDGSTLHHLADSGYRVEDLTFSDDEEHLAYVSTMRTTDDSGKTVITRAAKVWDVASGAQEASLQPASTTATVASPIFSPDGRWLAALALEEETSSLLLWDVEKGVSEDALLPDAGMLHSVAFSPDGTYAAALVSGRSGAADSVYFWTTDDWTLDQRLGLPSRAASHLLQFSPDGAGIAVAGSNEQPAHVWQTEPEGDGWRNQALQEIATDTGRTSALAYSPDGSRLAVAMGRTLHLWKTEDGSVAWSSNDVESAVEWLGFAQDGEKLLSAEENGKLRMYDATTGDGIAEVDEHLDLGVNDVAVAGGGDMIIAGGSDGRIRFWNVADDDTSDVLAMQYGSVDGVSLSPDGDHLGAALSKPLSANVWDDRVQIWDVSRRELVQELEAPHAKGAIASCNVYRNKVAFSPDGSLIASPSFDHHVRAWQTEDGELLTQVERHELAVVDVCYSPDGGNLASASTDGTVQLWRDDGSELTETLPDHFAGATSVAYSPDGSLLATSDATGQVHIWRARNGKKLRTLDGLKNNISNLEFSPDGALLAAGGIAGAIEFWETETWHPVHSLPAHRGRVNVVRFSEDGGLFVSGAEDGTIRLWEPPEE